MSASLAPVDPRVRSGSPIAERVAPKRALSEDTDGEGAEEPHLKRAKSAGPSSTVDAALKEKKRKRGRKKTRKVPIVHPQAGPSSPLRERPPVSDAPRAPTKNENPPLAAPSTERTSVSLDPKPPAPASSLLPEQDGAGSSTASQGPPSEAAESSSKGKEKDVPHIAQAPPADDSGQPEAGPSSAADVASTAAGVSSPAPQIAADAALAQLLAKHTALLDTLSQAVTCQICLNALHTPYALQCGHVACKDCLLGWFRAPGQDANAARRPLWQRLKTCPHCRRPVRTRPSQVYALKSVADALARSGLVPEPFAAPPPAAPAPDDADAWDGIFAAHGAPGEGRRDDEGRGIRDDEDGGVYRCYDCMHEIWDGECTGCGRVYPLDDDDDPDGDFLDGYAGRLDVGGAAHAFGDADDLMVDDLDMDDVGDWMAHYGFGRHRAGPRRAGAPPVWEEDNEDVDEEFFPPPWAVPAFRADLDDDDDDIFSDGGEFSDDDDIPVWPGPDLVRRARFRAMPEDEDEEYEVDFIDDGPQPAVVPDVIDLLSDDEPAPRRAGRIVRIREVLSDDDDDDEDDDVQVIEPAARRFGGRGRANAPIVLSSDEDEDDDGVGAGDDEADGEDDEGGDEEPVFRGDREDHSDLDDGDGDIEDAAGEDAYAEEEEDDGSIRRIPMHLAREFSP